MTRVVLQPAASRSARDHLDKTVWEAVTFGDHKDTLSDSDLHILRQEFPSGHAAMWGITPGESGSTTRWDPISPGDVALFAGQGRIFLKGVVRHKFRNQALAKRLWGEDEEGRTWELMYALAELEKVDLPYAELNRLAGYATNNVVQGLSVLDPERSAGVLDGLGIAGWHLQPGDTIRRTDLHARYGGSGQSGISPSRRTANVLIFADPGSGSQHGYIHDQWVDDQLFVYTGEGQTGDQQLTAGNKAIAEHRDDGRALRLFYGAGGVVTYAGRFEVDRVSPYEWLMAPPSGGGSPRKVLGVPTAAIRACRADRSDFDAEWTALQEHLEVTKHWESLGDRLRYEVTAVAAGAIGYSNAAGNSGKVTKARLQQMWDLAKASPTEGTAPNTRVASALLALLPNIEFSTAPLQLFWVSKPSHPMGEPRERTERSGETWDGWEYELLFMRHPPRGVAPEPSELSDAAEKLGRSTDALAVTWQAGRDAVEIGESPLASARLREYLLVSGWTEEAE